jgi:ABC-2 type transport system ATP-binding protein
MLQRIGLAQALVHDPQLVILDEPTAGVDPMGTVAIAEIIKRLKAEGKTILISSHLLSQMEGLCDRVAILHRGRLMCEGSVSELLNDGSVMNFQVKGLDASKELQVSKFIESLGGSVEGIEPARAQLEGLFKDVLTTDENAEGAGKEDSQ